MAIARSSPINNTPRSPRREAEGPQADGADAMLDALDDASDDVRRLAAEIDALLASSRARSSGSVGSLPQREPTIVTDTSGASDDAEFAWAAEGSVAPQPQPLNDVTARGHGWLAKARRERRVSSLQHTLAWIITLIIGGTIIAATCYLIFGSMPDFDLLTKIGTRATL